MGGGWTRPGDWCAALEVVVVGGATFKYVPWSAVSLFKFPQRETTRREKKQDNNRQHGKVLVAAERAKPVKFLQESFHRHMLGVVKKPIEYYNKIARQ